jgi:ABC-type transporter Mla subunit MlaD
MATDDTSAQITMVPVKRYDVNLTLDDILNPLTQTASNLNTGRVGAALDPEVAQHLQTFTDLVTQLRDVVARINQIDPTLLASKPAPPAGA